MSKKFNLLNPNIGDSYEFVLEDAVSIQTGSQDTNETQQANQTENSISYDQNQTTDISDSNST